MSKQVMQRALDALEDRMGNLAKADAAIAELRAAIAQPEPEPDAWLCQHNETGRVTFVDRFQIDNGWAAGNPSYTVIKPCYTAPPDAEALRKELERVKGEMDAMAMDAKRYRWLRDTESFDFSACKGDLPIGEEFDALMDAAIAAQGEGA